MVFYSFFCLVSPAESIGNPHDDPQIDSVTPFFNQLDACDIGGFPTTCDVIEIKGSDLRTCDAGSGVCELIPAFWRAIEFTQAACRDFAVRYTGFSGAI